MILWTLGFALACSEEVAAPAPQRNNPERDATTARSALVEMSIAVETSTNFLNEALANSTATASTIQDPRLREDTLAQIQKIYDQKYERLAEAARISTASIASMRRRFNKVEELDRVYEDALQQLSAISSPDLIESVMARLTEVHEQRSQQIKEQDLERARGLARLERTRTANHEQLVGMVVSLSRQRFTIMTDRNPRWEEESPPTVVYYETRDNDTWLHIANNQGKYQINLSRVEVSFTTIHSAMFIELRRRGTAQALYADNRAVDLLLLGKFQVEAAQYIAGVMRLFGRRAS